MCVIVYKPKKAKITKKVLRQCWDANPDNAGFMFADNSVLTICKGYTTFRTFYKGFRKQEKLHNENFVLHFRIATHGKIDKANCHPFVVNKNIGFVHNGILNCVDATKEKSDTSVFCKQVLRKLPNNFLDRKEHRVMLESVCKSESSKFVFLTNKGTAHIFSESTGIWQGGCWFSNTYFAWDNKSILYSSVNKQDLSHKLKSNDYAECIWCGDYYPKESHLNCCGTCVEELEQDKFPLDYDYNSQ